MIKKAKYFPVIFFLTLCSCNNQEEESYETYYQESIVKDTKVKKVIDSIYPFSKVAYIKIYSYPNRSIWDVKKGESGGQLFNSELIKDGTLNFDKSYIKDEIRLNKTQKEILFDVLYNKDCESDEMAACYNPRHLITFYNSKNQIFEYIEFCLECSNYQIEEKTKSFTICHSKADTLKQTFQKFGVKYYGDKNYENGLFEKRRKNQDSI